MIARALACDPQLIVADEPVSMLDVSLRAGVLELLAELRRERGLSLLYITHDLLSARVVTDEILVLHHGEVVERGETKQVLQHPQHDYTVQLLDAVRHTRSRVTAAGAPSHPTGSRCRIRKQGARRHGWQGDMTIRSPRLDMRWPAWPSPSRQASACWRAAGGRGHGRRAARRRRAGERRPWPPTAG